jgi:hypothetical protein
VTNDVHDLGAVVQVEEVRVQVVEKIPVSVVVKQTKENLVNKPKT